MRHIAIVKDELTFAFRIMSSSKVELNIFSN